MQYWVHWRWILMHRYAKKLCFATCFHCSTCNSKMLSVWHVMLCVWLSYFLVLQIVWHHTWLSFFADINECEIGIDNCDVNAVCSNTFGSFECTCSAGFVGNGVDCTGKTYEDCTIGEDRIMKRDCVDTLGTKALCYYSHSLPACTSISWIST